MARPPRLKDFDYRGCQQIFLTICTRDRARVFTDAALVESVMSHFLRTATQFDVEATAYCVMPDHLHVLATGTSDAADLMAFPKMAKQHAGYEYRRATGCRLWQEGFYDHVLRSEDAAAAVIRYTVNNPLRAGLVQQPDDYAYWGSQVHSREEILEFIQGIDEWQPPWKRGGRV